MTTSRAMPGPPGHPIFGSLAELRADAISYLRECVARYGRVLRLRMPWPIGEMILVSDAALAERIFIRDADSFRNSRMTQRMAEPILGNGLLLAEGDSWLRQRRLVQPAFVRPRVAGHVEDMAVCAEAMVDSWLHDTVRDVYADALAYTIRVAANTMFGASLRDESEAERTRRALQGALVAFDRFKNSRLPLPLAIPTPNGLRLRRAARDLEGLIYDLIEQRRHKPRNRADLLDTLLHERDARGEALSDRQVRDEAITAFAGGTETVAVALAWSLALLAQHRHVLQRIRAEVIEVVGDARVSADHVKQLRYTDRVIRESLRMFPPVWRSSRETSCDYVLEGYTLKKGTEVVVSQHINQHDAAYFEQPDRFNPDRWTAAFTQGLPRFAYFPFGAGQRMCIGHSFALTELVVALATAVRRVDFALAGALPTPSAGSMLRPRGGVWLSISRL